MTPDASIMKGLPTARPIRGPGWTTKFAWCFLLAVLITLGLNTAFLLGQDLPSSQLAGQKLYLQHCCSCHGKRGEGQTKHYQDPLHGDLSVGELTRYIADSMPEKDPDLVVGEDAQTVAQFVFDQFYSEVARTRNQPPRVELARLTVAQYRNRVADLLGTFTGPNWLPTERGLKARYFASRHATESRKIAEQRDPEIDFATGVPYFDPTGKYKDVPKPKKKPANQMNVGFSAYWRGGLIAPVTGEYLFTVKSKNGFQLFINDGQQPLIDRKVRSDQVVRHQGKRFLLAGRLVHFRLDLFSYTQPPAQIEVCWQPPGQPERIIPQSALTPVGTAEVLAISTPFPPDDASAGFERGVDVSAQWDRATTSAAIEAAEWISERIERLAGFKLGKPDASAKARQFCEQLVARAFVTDLSDADRQRYVGQHFDAPLSIQDQVKRVVLMTLKSPRFLFPAVEPRTKSQQAAVDMAGVMWDSLPSKKMLDDVAKGKFKKRKQCIDQLYGMTNHPLARQKLASFFESWISGHEDALTKDPIKHPGFDDQLTTDLKSSLKSFLDDVAWSESSDYRQLFLAKQIYVNPRIAKFYDWKLEPTQGFHKITVDSAQHQGLLTHPYVMAKLAYHAESSPIHRGVFVAKRLLGRQLRQPPNNVKPLSEAFAPEMTTRERVEHQTKAPTCMNCHSVINPLGFSLENFDAVGRFRKQDDEKSIDTTSVFRTRKGEDIRLNGPRDLAQFLAEDEHAQKNFIRQLFRYYTKNEIAAYGITQIDRLHRRFVEHEFRIRDLIVDIGMVVVDANLSSGQN